MVFTAMRRFLHTAKVLSLALLLAGCVGEGSKTTDTDSSAFTSGEEKKHFLERYVKFRRSYEQLEFDIFFNDGGDGGLPSPTEFDIRIFARVPAGELDEWTNGLTEVRDIDSDWVLEIPSAPGNLDGFKWFADKHRTVGVLRSDRVLVYRNLSQ